MIGISCRHSYPAPVIKTKSGSALFRMIVLAVAISGMACSSRQIVPAYPVRLLQQSDFVYNGGFALPADVFADSSVNWSEGVMEVSGDSLFIVGNEQQDALAQFRIPPLQIAGSVDELPAAAAPIQGFSALFQKLNTNSDNLDQILGLKLYREKLLINAIEYYDAPADNTLTTMVLDDPNFLAQTPVGGPFALRGGARAAGWLSDVPAEWQSRLGCTHISGNSSGRPIIGRHSVGPSAFCVNLADFLPTPEKNRVDSRELLGFTQSYPLETDLLNESGANTVWTHISQATYGFIVPGTATYATFGRSGGHLSGVGYKLERAVGPSCDGHCAKDPDDHYRYYWLWDVRDLWRVALGRKSPSELRPYAWGEWSLPFEVPSAARLGGASYDPSNGLLYMSLLDARSDPGLGINPPVILTYRIDSNGVIPER
jgi:hypothetical protein